MKLLCSLVLALLLLHVTVPFFGISLEGVSFLLILVLLAVEVLINFSFFFVFELLFLHFLNAFHLVLRHIGIGKSGEGGGECVLCFLER